MQTQLLNLKTMADFKPFRAWRYNPEKIAIGDVMAPPYDVITPPEQDDLYRRSPYNCVRLILNREEISDHSGCNRYTRARDCFDQWRSQNILLQELSPAFYLYRQVFPDPSGGGPKERFALLGRLKLEPFEKNIVVPHEKTLAKPRQDRRKLLEATRTNFSPVFGLYEDPEGEMLSLYRKVIREAPVYEAQDDQQVSHALWLIQDAEMTEAIHNRISSRKIYIADGHHRYQTALEYARDLHTKTAPSDAELPSDFVLMALVEFHDPGLVLLPTHRMLPAWKGFEKSQCLKTLGEFFDLTAVTPEALGPGLKHADKTRTVFGLCLKGEQYLLTLREGSAFKKKMPQGKPEVWYHLDVNILGHLILASLWNLPETQWEGFLKFTQSLDLAVRCVQASEQVVSFLLRAPAVEILREMGRVQELMPQKSTYFYPKLASGLVFYHHA